MIERAELCVQRNSTLKAGCHAFVLVGQGGKQPGDVAAQLRAAAAASFGQEGEQLPQARDPRRMDDLAPLAGRLRQARRVRERRDGTTVVEGGTASCAAMSPAGSPLRTGGQQQPQQVEPGGLRQGGKRGSRLR